jgi:peptidyl-tRNA hydrolase
VLSKFHPEELDLIQTAVERAADAAVDWVREGIEFCMNRHNADIALDD